MSQAVGVYLHIPFCRRKCAYCDFNSFAKLEGLIPGYVSALAREVELWGDQGLIADTMYLGGGTPSLLPVEGLACLLAAAGRHLALDSRAEVSLEANPGTVDRAWLEAARRLGVNRLSLGVQSFSNDELRLLGRIHSAADAREAVAVARQAGFDNINLDLIYGLPGQALSCWRASVEAALRLAPQHLSLYSLTLEEGTPLARRVVLGEVPAPDPDQAADMYLLAEEMLANAGYVHYEISNWARPGWECQHNLIYWHNGPYLGLGAGGHSSLRLAQGGAWRGCRFHNVRHPETYIRRVAQLKPTGGEAADILRSRSPIEGIEAISPVLEMAETVILGLRLTAGVSLREFEERFGVPLLAVYGPQVQELRELALATVEAGHLRLTPRGRLLGNEAFWRFLPRGESPSEASPSISRMTEG